MNAFVNMYLIYKEHLLLTSTFAVLLTYRYKLIYKIM